MLEINQSEQQATVMSFDSLSGYDKLHGGYFASKTFDVTGKD